MKLHLIHQFFISVELLTWRWFVTEPTQGYPSVMKARRKASRYISTWKCLTENKKLILSVIHVTRRPCLEVTSLSASSIASMLELHGIKLFGLILQKHPLLALMLRTYLITRILSKCYVQQRSIILMTRVHALWRTIMMDSLQDWKFYQSSSTKLCLIWTRWMKGFLKTMWCLYIKSWSLEEKSGSTL